MHDPLIQKTTSKQFDVIVLGVGSMGSSTCWYLAKRGQKVLGLEQFSTPHENGSHAGQSRIIRKAYFEHPDYVPLLQRAYENWQSIERETGTHIYHRTGIVYFGKKENENIAGVRKSSGLYEIPVEDLDRSQSQQRFPAFNVPEDFNVIFEPDSGFVTPERAIEMYVGEAKKLGAEILTHTRVLSWRQEAHQIRVVTAKQEYTCEKLIITAGAWTSSVIPQLKHALQVTRQLLAWVSPPDPSKFSLGNFPCWLVEDPELGSFYGFPILPVETFPGPVGLKLAHHHPGIPCGPDEIAESIPSEEEKLLHFLKTYLPDAGDQIISVKHCLYTNSPDAHFIIDQLPGHEDRVTIACGFSGHGFKFVSVVGEILADLAMQGKTDLPIGFLRIGRF